MKYLRSIVTWIASFESGGQFRKWVSILLKILGVLTLIGAVVWGIMILVGSLAARSYVGMGTQTLVVIGSIVALCINIIVGTILTMLFWNRANKISALGEESHLTLIPIAVILIRLFGEVGFLSLIGTGIQGLVSSIFGSGFPGILNFALRDLQMYGNASFIIGVIFLVMYVLGGAIVLIFHYFIAELINLFADMATNLKKIETTLSAEETTSDS